MKRHDISSVSVKRHWKRISTNVRISGDGEETEEEQDDDDEVKENTNPPSDPNRPSLKVIFIPIETRCFHCDL